jgi:hypothetical protein
MSKSPKYSLLAAGMLLAGLPAVSAETNSAVAPVDSSVHALVKCLGASGVPMTSDAEQALPMHMVSSLKCGDNVAILADNEGYTARVRTADGKEGFVARMYLNTDGAAQQFAASVQPASATPVNGVVRWRASEAGCDQFPSHGRTVESITANGITVQVSLQDTGWKLRASIAVSNQGDSTEAVFSKLVTLDELQPGLRALPALDPSKMAHTVNHQVLRTEENAQPSASAVNAKSNGTATLTAASYQTPDYLGQKNAFEQPRTGVFAKSESVDIKGLSLKSTALKPGEQTAGVMWFERDPNARELSLRVSVGNVLFDFPLSFEQKK